MIETKMKKNNFQMARAMNNLRLKIECMSLEIMLFTSKCDACNRNTKLGVIFKASRSDMVLLILYSSYVSADAILLKHEFV